MKQALACLSATLLLVACTDSPEELAAKARSAYASHDYVAARLHLAEALRSKPADRQLLLLQARTLLALGDGDGAGAVIDKLGDGSGGGEVAELAAEAALLRRVPDRALAVLGNLHSPEAERLRALAALQKNDFGRAGDHLAAAVAAGGNARVFADYARYRLLSGDLDGADAMAAQARKVAPDGLDTLLVDGQLAVRHGDLQRALGAYARAAKLYPSSLAALTGQAAVLGDLGRFAEMTPLLDKAVAVAPKDIGVAYLRARAAAAKKDWKAVRAIVQPLERDIPAGHPLRLTYAEALVGLGQNEQAIAGLVPIVRAQPLNSLAVRLLATAQLASGDPRAAVASLRPLADLPSARPEELALMVRAARAAGDPRATGYEARSRQPAAQALGRDMADADNAMRNGNWAGAVDAYGRVMAMTDGRNVMVLNNLAYAHTMLGNHDKAIGFADRALRMAPDSASVLDTAGWARFKAGRDLDQARDMLKRAAEKAPDNPAIGAHLAEAMRAAG